MCSGHLRGFKLPKGSKDFLGLPAPTTMGRRLFRDWLPGLTFSRGAKFWKRLWISRRFYPETCKTWNKGLCEKKGVPCLVRCKGEGYEKRED